MYTIKVLTHGMNVGSNQARLGLSSVILLQGEQNILVDVGHFGRRILLVESLEKEGLKPEDISSIILTHSHWDHCQNVDLFPNAKLYIHQKEIEYANNPRNNDWATPKYFNKTIENHNISIITEETEIESGIQIIETPGHTRGHISVVVSTNDGNAVIAGDSLTDAFSLQRGTPGLIFWSKKEASESVEKIRKIASVVYPGHDRPFTIKPNGEIEYKEGPTSVTFTGGFENTENGFSVTLNLEKTRVPWIHEEA
ncbi:MAG: N-acyl homoserine lactonase family protein [Dehalococcoidia bacterium]